ncbi:MAG TPA: Glu-tRNA(Gln) amidotransferase subunit GatE [Nitrososphaerales archaeon]|nr:Glu-tRNA(Gln) amidotransferase subunit GatE [Nitrososphaerales archaeon]
MEEKRQSEELLVGLEIHQQLACSTKLFCSCPPVKSEVLPCSFERRLRPAQSETGGVDPAAVFEFAKGRSNRYFWSPESSCLVEADEEPPHPLSSEGLGSALLVARVLGSILVDEVHVMRKIVIDGSNTGGFQRTAVVGLGGAFDVDGARVEVQSVTLEEDAARILGEDSNSRHFGLDRLGVALVEVALAPVKGDPELVGKVALHLGRILRSTGRVARGLGTIRQDLNVSLAGGKVIEVKGVQKLNLLPRVVEYERSRQSALLKVAGKLRERGVKKVACTTTDVTRTASESGSDVLRGKVAEGGKVVAISARGLKGLLGWEPSPGMRLGKEVAEVARANSLGGVIHSDEFGRQGIGREEETLLRKLCKAGEGDGIVLLAGPPDQVDACVPRVANRLREAVAGVPAETRAATDTGETRYMRPRPGSQRMYPETDIPNISVTGQMLADLAKAVPQNWEARVARLAEAYSLSRDMGLKLFDSELDGEFESLAGELKLEPSVVASVLVDLPARLAREGVPQAALELQVLAETLRSVARGDIAKEAIPDVLKVVGSSGRTVHDAIRSLGLERANEQKIRTVIATALKEHAELVSEKGDAAFAPLMGEAMKELRGRADGAMVAAILREELLRAKDNTSRQS